jgi:hypothetical protein
MGGLLVAHEHVALPVNQDEFLPTGCDPRCRPDRSHERAPSTTRSAGMRALLAGCRLLVHGRRGLLGARDHQGHEHHGHYQRPNGRDNPGETSDRRKDASGNRPSGQKQRAGQDEDAAADERAEPEARPPSPLRTSRTVSAIPAATSKPPRKSPNHHGQPRTCPRYPFRPVARQCRRPSRNRHSLLGPTLRGAALLA